MQCVGQFSTVKEVCSCLQRSNMFINSYVLEAELNRFEIDKPHVPLNKEMRDINLSALKRRIFSKGYATLDQVPGLNSVAFLLNSKSTNHWSLVIFDCHRKMFAHFDSADNINERLASKAFRLLITMGLFPDTTKFVRPECAPQQLGGWECGYAMLATALHYSGALRKMMPEVEEPRDVICNAERFQRFVTLLLVRATAARDTAAYHQLRLERIYRDE